MNPARTMGTFLRVWRSQWASLSRAQLAMAVSSQCGRRREIKPGVIRSWEDGQPPSSTEELDALLRVMGRHGLARPEVEQFRRAVFAACVDRQYPECFADEDFAQRRDVDELAAEVFRRAGDGELTYYQLPALVSQIGELENEVSGHLTPPAPGTQARKQAAALAYHKASLAHHHGTMGRFATSTAAWADGAAFMRNRLGPGALPDLALEQLLVSQRSSLLMETGSGAPMHCVLDLHRDAVARGQHYRAAWLLQSVLEVLSATDDEALCQWVRPMEREHLEVLKDVAREWLDDAHLHYLHLALRAGDLEKADTYVAAVEHCQHGGLIQDQWFYAMGSLAQAQGNRAEACSYWERGLAVAKARGHVVMEAGILRALRECT